MIGAILAFSLGFAKRDEMPEMFFIIAVSAVAGVLLEFIIRFFFMPPKAAKEDEEKLKRIEKIFMEMEERNATAYKKHTDLLESQIQTLQTRLDERVKRKVNKDVLGAYLEQLQLRILAIEKLDFFGYWDTLKDGSDQESDALAGKIRKFIAENIGLGEAASFSNLSGITLARFDESLGLSEMMQKKKTWLHKINHLDHYSIQLKDIIKNYHVETPENP